jgi:hypothetical protein
MSKPLVAADHAIASDDERNPKGEDATATHRERRVSAFGLFDGHGGPQCSSWCASGKEEILAMLPRLVASGRRLPTAKAVDDAFWKVDAEVGAALAQAAAAADGAKNAGSTATVLLVEKVKPRSSSRRGKVRDSSSEESTRRSGSRLFGQQEDESAPALGGLRCCWAWVGDSTGLTVDMTSGQLGACTKNHVPEVGPPPPHRHAHPEAVLSVGDGPTASHRASYVVDPPPEAPRAKLRPTARTCSRLATRSLPRAVQDTTERANLHLMSAVAAAQDPKSAAGSSSKALIAEAAAAAAARAAEVREARADPVSSLWHRCVLEVRCRDGGSDG